MGEGKCHEQARPGATTRRWEAPHEGTGSGGSPPGKARGPEPMPASWWVQPLLWAPDLDREEGRLAGCW